MEDALKQGLADDEGGAGDERGGGQVDGVIGHGEEAVGERAHQQAEEQCRPDQRGGDGDQQRDGEHQRQLFARVVDAEVNRLFAVQRQNVQHMAFVPEPGEAGADDERGGEDEVGAGVGDCLEAGVVGRVNHPCHQVGELVAEDAEDDADEQQAVDVAREQRQEGGEKHGGGGCHQGGVDVKLPLWRLRQLRGAAEEINHHHF